MNAPPPVPSRPSDRAPVPSAPQVGTARFPVLALGLVPLLPVLVTCASKPGPTEEERAASHRVEAVDRIFAEWHDPEGPGATVAVTSGGKIVLSRGYGSAQLEYGVPLEPGTPVHVASVSKQFTTFAVALLERDGKLSWDDEVGEHLAWMPDLGHPITLRQLATHTSGVRDQWELLMLAGWRMDDVITRDQILRMMERQRELNFEPGSDHLYSNMGYSLLAEVVAEVSGREFGAFLQERVFDPLGMEATHVHHDHTHVVPGRAYSYTPLPRTFGHARSGPERPRWAKAVLSYANQGATSLFTTAEDLARWIGEMEGSTVGDPVIWDTMREPTELGNGELVPYGLGLSVGRHRGRPTVGHGGADAGFRSHLLHFPDEGLGVVVLGNAANLDAAGAARRVADVFLEEREEEGARRGGSGVEPVDPTSVSGALVSGGGPATGAAPVGAGLPGGASTGPDAADPVDDPSVYAGDYYSPELDTVYRVRLHDGRLAIEHQRRETAELQAAGRDRFRSTGWPAMAIRFLREGDGEPEGFRVTTGRVRDLLFQRVEPVGGDRATFGR